MQEKFDYIIQKEDENSIIIIISRFPRAGESKTRLIPHLGAEKAANLQKEMTEFISYEAFLSKKKIQVHFNGSSKEEMQKWIEESILTSCKKRNAQLDTLQTRDEIANRFDFIPQREGDLGIKLKAALEYAYVKLLEKNQTVKRKKIVIIGADCPSIRKELLEEAFQKLEEFACVIGKSEDGGYYLLGSAIENKEELPKHLNIYDEITWGTETVYQESVRQIKNNNLSYTDLAILNDVDYKEDIPLRISVVIPVYNEEKNIAEFFENLPTAFNIEYILVDGESTDETFEISKKYADIVLKSEKGRSNQMDFGAKHANGDIILFLHIDSILPPSFDSSIRNILADKALSLGYFDFAFKEEADKLKKKRFLSFLLCFCANFRSKHFKRPYGDQGLFVRRKDYFQWNLPTVPILEDVFLVKKALNKGKIKSAEKSLKTSNRRWIKYGFFKVSFINQSVLLAAKLGMDLEKIKDCYWQGKNPLFRYVKEIFRK